MRGGGGTFVQEVFQGRETMEVGDDGGDTAPCFNMSFYHMLFALKTPIDVGRGIFL